MHTMHQPSVRSEHHKFIIPGMSVIFHCYFINILATCVRN